MPTNDIVFLALMPEEAELLHYLLVEAGPGPCDSLLARLKRVTGLA